MPEVAATAAPVHSTAAPGYVDEPAITPVTPWVYLSSCGPGTGQRAATSPASKPSTSVSGRSSPMSISVDVAAVGERVHGLEPAERDGQRGVHGGAGDRAGRHVDAAGDVDRDHRDPGVIDRGEHLGRRRSQRTRAGDAHHPVDDEIGCRRDTARRRGRRPCRNAASPLRWVWSGLSSTASAAAPRRRTKVAAHSASPPLSPEPTTAHTRRPATPPVRAVSSPMISVASPKAARLIRAPSGRLASSGASASRIASTE